MAKTMAQTNEARIVMLESEVSKLRLELALAKSSTASEMKNLSIDLEVAATGIATQAEHLRIQRELLDRYVGVLEKVADAVFGDEP